MTTVDLITEARRRYLQSGRTRRDWVRYVVAVETIRRRPDAGPGADLGAGGHRVPVVTAAA